FLLMTATPHNGKEEDFQIFMALLDGDRFEGKFRDGVHTADPSDLMRRMVKEDILRFDGTPLFPERRSHTVQYELSPPEAHLYREVTDYVRGEMNGVERREAEEGGGQQRVNVGFALMILQRRLASSPEAIYRSLTRRHERLASRLREARILFKVGRQSSTSAIRFSMPSMKAPGTMPTTKRPRTSGRNWGSRSNASRSWRHWPTSWSALDRTPSGINSTASSTIR
ncbi:MAG: hypothetical protein O7G88_10430, partial [bacterium]|nr:hypothetical protein [bacterium]